MAKESETPYLKKINDWVLSHYGESLNQKLDGVDLCTKWFGIKYSSLLHNRYQKNPNYEGKEATKNKFLRPFTKTMAMAMRQKGIPKKMLVLNKSDERKWKKERD